MDDLIGKILTGVAVAFFVWFMVVSDGDDGKGQFSGGDY